jgi:hypothetical protein
MKYKDFDQWFWEIENYSTRGERFYDECTFMMTDKRIVEWLKAAWECARMEEESKE